MTDLEWQRTKDWAAAPAWLGFAGISAGITLLLFAPSWPTAILAIVFIPVCVIYVLCITSAKNEVRAKGGSNMHTERMKGQRIADDLGRPNHGEAADYFNQLLIDLKKQMLGHDHEAITMDRLNEGTQHVLDLDKCRSETRFY